MKSTEIPLVVANEHGSGQAESQIEREGDVVGSLLSKSWKENSPGMVDPKRVKVPYPYMI